MRSSLSRWTVSPEVSTIRSAISRRCDIALRSARMPSRTLPSTASGWRRRVSWYRRTRLSSLASRKRTSTGWPRVLSSWIASSRWDRYSPSRTSTPSATRRIVWPDRATRSAKVGISVVGRLSTQKKPMSSKHLIAWLLPAPLRPVMTTKVIGSATLRPGGGRSAPPLGRQSPLVGRQDPQLFAILRDRAARDRESPALEDLGDLLVTQRLRGILVGQQVLDHLLDRHRRHHLAVARRNTAMEEELQLEQALGRLDVLVGRDAADRRLVHADVLAD